MTEADGMTEVSLLGYGDKLTAAPGERICFMVSTDHPTYSSDVVRLLHGASDSNGPALITEPVAAAPAGTHRGRIQSTRIGSFGHVPFKGRLRDLAVTAWIWPTLPDAGRTQGIIANFRERLGGFSLHLDAQGRVALRISDGLQADVTVRSERPLDARSWYFVLADFDAGTATATILYRGVGTWGERSKESVALRSAVKRCGAGPSDFLIGAAQWPGTIPDDDLWPLGLYNGKIDAPRVYRRSLGPELLNQAYVAAEPPEAPLLPGRFVVGAWDLAIGVQSATISDTGRSQLHGTLRNCPARAVTGHNWSGQGVSHRTHPSEYGAVHFHDDDLGDAGWKPDLHLTVPHDLPSGVYALRLRSGGMEDHIPFFVRPRRGASTAEMAVLFPTFTYMAYANERMLRWFYSPAAHHLERANAHDRYVLSHPGLGLSLYDTHSDGSGVCYSSRLRPILNMRPAYRWWLTQGPERLPADLYLSSWLRSKEFTHDTLTDEDLHQEGSALLEPYRAVLLPTHPEYWTEPMLDSLDAYLRQGGRVMYLGGNGLYWVTGVHADAPHIIEVRRTGGSRTWEAAAGETYLSTTGEPGGLWRHRGRPPNALVGVGFAAQDGSASRAAGYVRLPDSFSPRARFIFEGVAADEIIGDFGLMNGGAAGYEIDRFDLSNGSPPSTLVLATSAGRHGPGYFVTVEDILETGPGLNGPISPRVRADMIYLEGSNGSRVFSVGSINWCGSLSHHHGDNNVSRITENVLRAFLQP
ncbi:MAG TPA: N,N-dimethylformamidase beta subunit family domain-containing protein [Candidatus Micrarchaeia archaeon]|nr:N,N-dimethylformamidase beta subunit family domain-containing protein [Candidatus Micrarchaeia archaeon]